MADRGRPIPIGAAIYASAHKAVQPPDDRTYSAEVTVFQRNLPHHRIARAVFPYTRSNIIPPRLQIVKKNFRENHKVSFVFSYNLRAAGRPANACTGLLYSLRHWACSVSLPLNHRRTAGRPVAAANARAGWWVSFHRGIRHPDRQDGHFQSSPQLNRQKLTRTPCLSLWERWQPSG